MKILHIIYTSYISGAENYLIDLLPGLKKNGIECDFICIGPKKSEHTLKKYCSEMTQRGVKTTLLLKKNQLQYFTIAKSINNYLIRNDISKIHSHLFYGDLLAVIVKIFYNKSIRIFSTKHGYKEEYLIKYGNGIRKIPNNLYYAISKFINKRIDENIATSKFIAEMYSYLKLGKKKMKFIHHGTKPKHTQLKDENINENENKNILVVGRLAKVKGHTFIIEAMPSIIKKIPSAKLIILGEGDLKTELQMQVNKLCVSENVQFLGFQKPEEYTKQCKVMVVPSLFEAFGLVIIEAFALKIPIVAFDVGASNEIIENNETGLLAAPFSTSGLASKIIYLLENREERNRLAENGYKKFINEFTVDKMVSATLQWYTSID